MRTEYVNLQGVKDFYEIAQKYYSLGHKSQKQEGKNMSDFDIKETVVQTGYVDKDGKFVPEADPKKVEPINAGPIYVQTDEDVQP